MKDAIRPREAFGEFLQAFPHLHPTPLPGYIPEARVFLISRRPKPADPGSTT